MENTHTPVLEVADWGSQPHLSGSWAIRDVRGRIVALVPASTCEDDTYGHDLALKMAAAPALLEALLDANRYLVTPNGVPDKGKGRTAQQQAAMDASRAALAQATGERER